MNDLILIFWIMDIMNLPFMEMFDTTYPLNEGFWMLVFIFCSFTVSIKKD